MQDYTEYRFKQQLDSALNSIRRILDTTRNPEQPSDVSHAYDDKYTLVELMTNTTLAAQSYVLEELGVTAAALKQMREWAKTRTVSLRFSAEQRCAFDREVKREVESATKHVTETTMFGNFKSGTVTTVWEYYWKFDADWELSAYAGTNADEKIVLANRSASHEIMTGSKDTPRKKVHVENPVEVSLAWYLSQLDAEGRFAFRIDRAVKSCKTPRRNADVDRAIPNLGALYNWTAQVRNYFTGNLFPVQTGHGLDLNAISSADSVFVPVIPLFEKGRRGDYKEERSVYAAGPKPGTPLLSLGDLAQFLSEQKRSMGEKYEALTSTFPNKGLISAKEAKMIIVLLHSQRISQHHMDVVGYVEDMLRKQLIAAIGKVVGPVEFAEYMRFHQRKLFKQEYQPKGFCYAIRRPEHYPEGTLSIEAKETAEMAQPVETCVNTSKATKPMFFAINAATNITFFGDRHLHATVLHQFSGQGAASLSLVARARQFSSFIMCVGTIQTGGEFKALYGTIIQNKDELTIPLLLETLPTPKEFADAIESLSPEQQRFCRAFRSMQLASTLFGVLIIQIKPQLEKLLGLPDDSLTKEIRLTQDLMEMFIRYQIPSDLISYDGNPAASVGDKLARVKNHVQAMQAMIQHSKDTELKEAAQVYVKEALAPSYGAVPVHAAVSSSSSYSATPGYSGGGSTTAQSGPKPPEQKGVAGDEDYTTLPVKLDSAFAKYDEDHALRSTIIKAGTSWTKNHQKGLLSKPSSMGLYEKEQKDEKNAAFDLLDALSRSGVLSVDQASLHIILAATHCFDKTLVETVIQENVNPIEKVERSCLIMASAIHRQPPESLITPAELPRVKTYSPGLF